MLLRELVGETSREIVTVLSCYTMACIDAFRLHAVESQLHDGSRYTQTPVQNKMYGMADAVLQVGLSAVGC